jgi:hypothetical protein
MGKQLQEDLEGADLVRIRNQARVDAVRKTDEQGELEEHSWVEKDREWPFKIRKASFQIIRSGLWLGFVMMAFVLGILLYHMVVPETWRWMKTEQAHVLSDLVRLVMGGTIGIFLNRFFKDVFNDLEKKTA